MVKYKDVALKAGVSVATVSRVMNQSGYVKEETKELVLKAFDELASKDKMFLHSITNKKTNIIGVVIPDISNPFFGEVIKGISSIADKENASLLECIRKKKLKKN